ncbi:MAG: hypothetical protein ACKV2T_15930 [Kofleriaceae bacterium]
MRILPAAIVASCLFARAAHAETELKNDGFVMNGSVGFELGFDPTEAGASRFVAPAAGRQLLKVQFLFGGNSTATQTITLKVFDDTAGTDNPGSQLFSADYSITGSDTAMQEINVAGNNITLPAQFRVAIVFQHDGAPSIARDDDGTITSDKNLLLSTQIGWAKSTVFGLVGDWVIRAFISDGGVAPPDGAVDGGVVGGPCTGNASCPLGQFCDLSVQTCTLECRTADDCGGGTCNSLGQCVSGGDAGCCQTDGGRGGGPIVVFGLATLVVASSWRRRRWRAR